MLVMLTGLLCLRHTVVLIKVVYFLRCHTFLKLLPLIINCQPAFLAQRQIFLMPQMSLFTQTHLVALPRGGYEKLYRESEVA